MSVAERAARIAEEIGATVRRVDDEAASRLVEALAETPRVFVAGAGRSGCAVRAFAMRLAHLGLSAHVVGETTTAALAAGDLLVVGSGSGSTGSMVAIAQKAAALGGRIALVTIREGSPIGELAEIQLCVPAPTPKLDGPDEASSIQPMGSLFEQSLLVVLDAVVLGLMDRLASDPGTMFSRHANLE
ncbi:MAG: 6-phospho-3-hexuloisomerase [Planctomycetaceae bacterium]|mgnify:CR=1 FL=1|nr:6-phospho-3-hexuloisomerase [Planctomycetaceae bacterium]MDP7276619.1 6-phospho-3-hexuloisomerase [Planctomycetaceae bacterium]